MAGNRDGENDLSSLRLRSSTRSPLIVSSLQPEQVISRPDNSYDFKKAKKDGSPDLNQLTEIVYKWPNWDVWPFKLGLPMLGLACAGSGYFLNYTFRKVLYLEHFSRVSSYAAVMGLPAFSASLFHGFTISSDILQEKTRCPVCLQVKSAVVQLVFGLGIPVVTAPMISYSTAAVLKDVYFPNIWKQPKEVWEFTRQVYRPIRGHLGVIGAAQVIVAMGLTYFEQECFYTKIQPVLQGKVTFNEYPSEEESINKLMQS